MKKTLIIGAIILLAISLSGCKSVAEKTAEKAIETASGGQADVDNNTLVLNTNGGTLQVGDKATLPDNFPSDVYVIKGDIKSSVVTNETSGFSVQVETSKSVSDVVDEYKENMKKDGWVINSTLNISGNTSMSAEKGNRVMTVTVSTIDGKTNVMVSTYTNSD